MSSRTIMPPSAQRQHRWSELVPPQTALTFVAMYDPAEGLLTFSGAELLPSEPPTPPTPHTPSSLPDTLDTPTTTAFSPMPCTPAPSTLADMQSLLDAYFRTAAATATGSNHAMPARASSTFDGLRCGSIPLNESGSTKAGTGARVGNGREKPLPARPPPPPDRDSVFAWSWLGRMAPDDPRELWDASGNDCHGGGCSGCACWPSVADSGYVSEGCDGAACTVGDDGDSFYFTPPEIEDPNEVRKLLHLMQFSLYFIDRFFLPLYTVVFRVLCDDDVDVRVHRRAGSRVRLHLVRERSCLCLSRTWPSTRPDTAILANFASTGTFAPVAASPRTGLPDHDRRATATAGIEGSQHVCETWSARIARRRRVMDLCRGGTHHNATTSARVRLVDHGQLFCFQVISFLPFSS